MSTTLTLNCLIFGQDLSRVFIIKILDTENVALLRELIKEKNSPKFNRILAHDLDLFKVSIPVDDDSDNIAANFARLSLDNQNPMSPLTELSEIFHDIPKKCIHVIVKLPEIHPSKPPSATPIGIGRSRIAFLRECPLKAPSSQGRPQDFYTHQMKPDRTIHCNRPYTASTTIPVTLLHPVFGQFQDDCEKYTPTRDDNKLVLELLKTMPEVYETENGPNGRAYKIREVLRSNGIDLEVRKIEGTEFAPDGDIMYNGHRYSFAEFKNEISSGGAEPYMQAGFYYLEATRKIAGLMENSVLPCIIILIFGPYICFAGAAWSERLNLQVLSTALPFHIHHSDVKLRAMFARHFGAYKRALVSLKQYYKRELPAAKVPYSPPTRAFPYRTHFISRADSAKLDFVYVSQPDEDKLLFFSRLLDGDDVCIKFVHQYSEEAHEHCASIDAAPRLRGFETLPGGWYMVVMDRIDSDYEDYGNFLVSSPDGRDLSSLHSVIRSGLSKLHSAGFVHGDVRAVNLLVSKNGEAKFRLVDFDWAGRIDDAQYPMNVYAGRDLWRPDGAYDGELITVHHDLQMMENIIGVE